MYPKSVDINLTVTEIKAVQSTKDRHVRHLIYLGIIHNRGYYLKSPYKYRPRFDSIHLPEVFTINRFE